MDLECRNEGCKNVYRIEFGGGGSVVKMAISWNCVVCGKQNMVSVNSVSMNVRNESLVSVGMVLEDLGGYSIGWSDSMKDEFVVNVLEKWKWYEKK